MRQRLLAIGGLSGSGKSTLARALATRHGAQLLRSDVERKRLFGVAETARLGPDGYTRTATERVYARLGDRARECLASGSIVIVDAVFQRDAERAAIAATASETGAHFAGLWLDAAHDVRRARVGARTGDASDATPDIVDAQAVRDCGDITWHRLAASGNAALTRAEAEAWLAKRWIGVER